MDRALHTIKSTMYHHKNDAYFPYFFIVGAGISVPEIPAASKIVDICKKTVLDIDPGLFEQCEETSKAFSNNGMKYYSSWIEYAFPNRINRSHLFKNLCSKAKISSANLMLAQILHSNEFANTVFTTNFDDSIKKALELMGTKNFFCSENAMDNLVVSNQTKDIQVIHVHGTFNFYDCANLEKEIDNVASQSGTISSAQLLSSFLSNQAPIIVGYSGWENDVIMRCLKERLSYPTPLQYIWICYNKQSYTNLPNWIKNNDSVIFVIPESEKSDCNETCDTLSWDSTSNNDVIDATMFFKRIISSFKLKTPLIFTDPYSYYSQKIHSVLPKNEDVLHLRHWTQRLKIIERDNTFEKLVHKLEASYIAKDYEEANNILSDISNLSLNEANAEFVCTSLIKEFIRDEDIVSSFDLRLKFHLSSLSFIEKNLTQLSNTASLISTLRLTLFTRFRYSEKERIFELFDKVIDLAEKDSRLLVIELIALGTKSDFVGSDQKKSMLQEILMRCPKDVENTDFVFLKYKALRELGRITRSNDSIHFIEEAERLFTILDDEIYLASLCLTKSEILPYITNAEVKEKWIQEIIDLLSSPNEELDSDLYIEIAANLSLLSDSDIAKYVNNSQIEAIITELLSNYSVDLSSCHSILHYSQCCELICRVTESEIILVDFCHRIFDAMSSFPHVCNSYLSSLHYVTPKYMSLPKEIVNDVSKTNVLTRIKENEHTNSLYLSLLHFVSSQNLIEDLSIFNTDVDYITEQRSKVLEGYEQYCNGNRELAESLFSEVMSCKVPYIAESAITNLAYMVRRNETKIEYSFEDLIHKISYLSEFDIMNILLYYTAKGETNNDGYLNAQEKLNKLSADERKNIIDWWSNISLVGEEESKLALSLITTI